MEITQEHKDQAARIADKLLGQLGDFVDAMERFDMTNEQWYLNFEDKLNELSVKDHTKKEEA